MSGFGSRTLADEVRSCPDPLQEGVIGFTEEDEAGNSASAQPERFAGLQRAWSSPRGKG